MLTTTDQAAASVAEALRSWDPTWSLMIQLATHVEARAFGFQIVNAAQEESQKGECVPSCSTVAADHLLQLLQDRVALAQDGRPGPPKLDTFTCAIESLHNEYFSQGPYQEWLRKSKARLYFGKGIGTGSMEGVSHLPWVGQLSELALYFLLWTEATNLKHTPELLWLICHIMLSSKNHSKACEVLESAKGYYSVAALSKSGSAMANTAALKSGFVPGVLLPARNRHGNAMRLGLLVLGGSNAYRQLAAPRDKACLAARQRAGLQDLKILGQPGELLDALIEYDLDYFGDGCIFLDMVIQPVFNLMAEQIGLMGHSGEQPALRLGYDDINESACIAQVLARLNNKLKEASGDEDAWGRLLNYFINTPSQDLAATGANAEVIRGALSRCVQRYPRQSRRLVSMASALRKAVTMAPEAAPVQSVDLTRQELVGYGCVGGSAPVGHLLKSLSVTNELWGQLLKKSFLETRSLGSIAVAFSRVYMMHAVMLCWMTLWAYTIPRNQFTLSAMFSGKYQTLDPADPDGVRMLDRNFYSDHGMIIARCASWGLLVHAVLHVVKDLLMVQLLWAPRAVRVCEKADSAGAKKGRSLAAHFARLVSSNQLKEGEDVMDIAPGVHNSHLLQAHNVATLLFWLACCFLLLDGQIESWPLHSYLQGQRQFTQKTGMPVWALYSLVYVGMWVVHQAWGALADLLPDKYGTLIGVLFRKDGRRAADFFFPYGNMSNSQDFKRNVVNIMLWVLVIMVKFLFDFFVVLQPLADQAAHRLIQALEDAAASGQPASWDRWAMSVIIIFSLWVAAALLIFYDTGLFWQLIGALYSTMVLGMHRRVGHVKDWYGLVWAFPGLDKKLAKRMLPEAHNAMTDDQVDEVAAQVNHSTIEDQIMLDVGNGNRAASNPGAINHSPMHKVQPCPPSEVLFAQCWNKVIDDLRQRDLVNHQERERLCYVEVCPAGTNHQGNWWLLPRFVAAGVVTEVTSLGVSAATQIEVISRSFNMLLWLLTDMDVITDQEMYSMLLVTSRDAAKQASPASGKGPGVASVAAISAAAEVLKDSEELLRKLKKMLAEHTPVSLGSVDTELLLESMFKVLKRCNGPAREFQRDKLSAGTWNHQAGQEYHELPVRRQSALQVIIWLLDMLHLTHGEAAPTTPEARRVLCFFATSLHNPNMPTASTVACTRSMTTLTPHYGEDVMYALNKTAAEQEMGVSGLSGGDDNTFLLNLRGEYTETLNYLKVVYKAEWANFVERLVTSQEVKEHLQKKKSTLHAADVGPAAFAQDGELHQWLHELLTFASMRGQLLQRTVHGMMYYETALQQLIVMQCHTQLAERARHEADKLGIQLRERSVWIKQVCEEAALLLARKKFAYVVSSQNLGEFSYDGNAGKRWLTYCIRNVLAKRYPSLKVAYLDLENIAEAPSAPTTASHSHQQVTPYHPLVSSTGPGRAGGSLNIAPRRRTRGSDKDFPKLLYRQYSVLLHWEEQAGCVKEKYRVRLPLNLETDTGVILGEGKPENQNHAAIFCHSETLQTIDCNQDGYFVEALKLPNLLAEFEGPHGRSIRNSLRLQAMSSKWRRRGWVQGPALVGFREWIFSEDSGALAEFAAATERSFGTTVQRVMHNPGAVRFHYGHPDVWDKLFTMTNGGVSKATKSLHVSEDVFGGYNVMLRGRDITYVDYHAVGKGRDMGFETILAFEGKIAGGNGEQVVSRDIQRLARRLNFTRLMSWYHTGNGFFINTGLIMFSLLVNAWLVLLLALSSSTAIGSTVVGDVLALLGGLQLVQLGSLSLLVYVATVWLEDGLLATLKNVLKQLVAGSFLFYVFRGQTTAHYFLSDVKYGGAKYAATGRGYKLQATPFMDLFQLYARSHMWFGAHLLVLVLTAVCVGLKLNLVSLFSYLIVIAALLCAPFWFNPFTWDWDRNKLAACEFTAWMAGHKPAGKSKLLWRTFNDEQLKQAADDNGRQLGRTFKNIIGSLCLLPIAVAIGFAVAGMLDAWWKSVILVGAVNLLLGLLAVCWLIATHLESMKGAAFLSRVVKFNMKLSVLSGLVVMFVFMVRPEQRYLFQVIARVLYVEFEIARMISMLLLNFFPRYQPARRLVNRMCWIADFAVGLLLLLLLFIGSLFGLLMRYQAAVLFGEGYSRHYLAQEALANSEVGRLAREVQEMKQKQRTAGDGGLTGAGDVRGGGRPEGGDHSDGARAACARGAAGPSGTSHVGDMPGILQPQTSPLHQGASSTQHAAAAPTVIEQTLGSMQDKVKEAERIAGLLKSVGSNTIGRLALGPGGVALTAVEAAGGSLVESPGTDNYRACSVTRGAAGSSALSRSPGSSTPEGRRSSAASLSNSPTVPASGLTATAVEPQHPGRGASKPGSWIGESAADISKEHRLQPVFAAMSQQQQQVSGGQLHRADSWITDVTGDDGAGGVQGAHM